MIETNANPIEQIRHDLLSWSKISGRSFPWRQTRDSYKILVAEKLLQRTTVRPDLIQAYESLTQKYPTIHHLARADVRIVYNLIQSLGLHYRANELVELASIIQARYSGVIPTDFGQLMQLPGVGDYIARALLCFAFGVNVPIVDTNVARILFRIFDIQEEFPQNPARKKSLLDLAATLLPEGSSRNFNLAMLDLGALICKYKNPTCGGCPLLLSCAYGKIKLVNSGFAQ